MITVIDDLLPGLQHKKILTTVSSSAFLWQWFPSTVEDYPGGDSHQFYRLFEAYNHTATTHDTLFEEGITWRKQIIEAVQTHMDFEVEKVMRARVNMLFPIPNPPMWHGVHTDITTEEDIDKYYSLLYYVNDADGDTFFFPSNGEGQQTTPAVNRVAVFPAAMKHASSSPSENRRLVINIVVKVK